MTPRLDVVDARDVAVQHGIDNEAALAHLCRSLVTGSVFDAYRALVIDLGGCPDLAESSGDDIGRASAAYRQRRQWLGVVGAASGLTRTYLGVLAGVAGLAVETCSSVLRRFGDERPSPQGHTTS